MDSIMMKQNGDIDTFAQVIDALYGVFHLEFFHFILPPFCISSGLKSIHIAFFGYISIFYPLLLILLTWVSVELHGRNFRPLVWLWSLLHRCFVRLRRSWDTKSDIIDVFITFLFLSHSTVMHQTMRIIRSDTLLTIDASGKPSISLEPSVDYSLTYNDAYYYLFAVLSSVMFLVFNLLPPLLLILYPMKTFQSCLSRCHLNSIALNIFVEKIQGCYRNGLDGGRDMRSFSGLYLLLQLLIWIAESFAKSNEYFPPLFLSGILFSVIALTIALVKPYKKNYMTYLDTLILFNLAVMCFVSTLRKQKFPILQVLLSTPIVAFIVVILHKKVVCVLYNKLRCKQDLPIFEPTDRSTVDSPSPVQPLIQPTSTVLSYNTMQ